MENVLFRDPIEESEDSKHHLFVQIIDFGIAGACSNDKGEKIDAGSIHYMPPECFEGIVVESNPGLDVWAIGLMFYSLLYGTLPFFHEDDHELIKRIKTAKLRFDPKVPVTEEAKQIITKMLERDPSKRFDLADLFEMDYYKYEEDQFKTILEEFEISYA